MQMNPEPLDEPLDERTMRMIKRVISVIVAALWIFVLYMQVVMSWNRLFWGPDLPNPTWVHLAMGALVIVVTFAVAGATTWCTRRLPVGFIAVFHIFAMMVLLMVTWL